MAVSRFLVDLCRLVVVVMALATAGDCGRSDPRADTAGR